MQLTNRQREVMEAYARIGKGNLCGRQIADGLGISYRRLNQIKGEILARNGYLTFLGALCDWVRENA